MSFFLVVVLLLTLAFGSSLILLQNKMKTVHQCRVEALDIQTQVRPILEKLLGLNPLAKALRAQKILVEIQILAAAAAWNEPLVAALVIRRRAIVTQQQVLDKTQQGLIFQANWILASKTLKAHYGLRALLQRLASQQNSWAETSFQMLPPRIPKLAVRPKDRRLAPEYEPQKDFEQQQAVRLFWRQSYQLKGFLKSYKFSNPHIKNQCLATLELKTWQPKIQKDRPY